MWDWMRFRWQLSKLQRSLRRVDRIYEKHIQNAYRDKDSGQSADKIRQERHWETSLIDDEISILVTRYLLARANRKFLPNPSHDEGKGYWDESRQLGTRYLTSAGITELRRTLRAERADASGFWLSTLSTLIGIIGALTGLVALLLQYQG